ncbi:glycosyltransferase family 4 protein [Leptothoe sp. LEGE 181152]|nr:glycosyltransferase family 4 protein [Leptothoe sp. LEGE 181152]
MAKSLDSELETVVFLNPVGFIGGGERVLLSMMSALRSAQPNLNIYLILGTEGSLASEAAALGVSVELLPLPMQLSQLGDSGLSRLPRFLRYIRFSWQAIRAIPALSRYLSSLHNRLACIRPDLIHSNGIKTHLLLGIMKRLPAPVVWHIHDFYSTRPLIGNMLRRLASNVDLGIAVSEAVARDVRTCLPNLSVTTIYNTVDLERFTFTESEVEVPNQPLKVGLVATFAKWKGHDIFLDAAKIVVDTMPDCDTRFCIVGGPIYKTQGSQFSEDFLRARVQYLGINEHVEFWGFQKNVAEAYQKLAIVVHASTQPEPFGLVILEAMASGKPVIVSRSGGAVELFTHNYDGVGFESGNAKELANAIDKLVRDVQFREELASNARKSVAERFSQTALGDTLIEVYRSVKTNPL